MTTPGGEEPTTEAESPSTEAESPSTEGVSTTGSVSEDPAVAGASRVRRHAAEERGLRLPAWMLVLGAVIVIAVVVWLIVALSGDDDDGGGSAADSVAASTTRVASAASLPKLLCTGPSYVVLDSGASDEEMLADVSATEAAFPGSRLSTVPGGCIQGSTAVDDVVLALGPFDTFEAACAEATSLQGVTYQAYAGSADTGLVQTTCS